MLLQYIYRMESTQNVLKMSPQQLNSLSSKIISMNVHIDPPNKKYKKKQKQLTPEQIQVFRQAFQIFDHDHSGSIDQDELESLLSALGFNYSPAEVQRIFAEVDTDCSGVIEMNEFVLFMSKQLLDTESLKVQILKVFRHFDEDNSGYLNSAKIRNMLNECFFNLDDNAINSMIAAADTDGDGKISEYEFMRIMKKVKLV